MSGTNKSVGLYSNLNLYKHTLTSFTYNEHHHIIYNGLKNLKLHKTGLDVVSILGFTFQFKFTYNVIFYS